MIAKLRLEIELEYDATIMHADDNDSEAKRWFFEDILLNPSEEGELILHSNSIGDEIGTVKVLRILE